MSLRIAVSLPRLLAALAAVSLCGAGGAKAASDNKPLVSPVPSKEAQAVYDYICSLPGKGILSGQQELPPREGGDSQELKYVKATTGKLPAILGLDFIEYPGVVERAKDYWKRGGIPSICWHWGAPTKGQGYEASKLGINVADALTPGTALNRALMADIDRTALELKKLRDAGVPVLWRPLHELNGNWFWWGKAGPEDFKELWKLLFRRLAYDYQLDNLIWVFGYTSNPDPDWYPGDEYVDIAGADAYSEGTQGRMYRRTLAVVGPGRPVAYHECGPIPNPDDLLKEDIRWVWFLTWHTKHVRTENSPEELKRIYNHPYVITLDEVPDLGRRLQR